MRAGQSLYRLMVATVMAAGMIGALAACSAQPVSSSASTPVNEPTPIATPTRSPNDVNDAGAIEQSYRNEVAELKLHFSLPRGRSYPSASMLTWDPEVHIGPESGAGAANFYWRCAWSDQYYEASMAHHVKARNEALDMLEKWPSTRYYKEHVEDSDPGWQKAVIDTARAGDDGMLRSFSGPDCAFFYANNPPKG
jgi:hypothetical protein